MYDLHSTFEDFDNDSEFAYSVIANIAIVGDSIPESMMQLYMAPVTNLIDDGMLLSSAAYFHGADILNVECDCSSESPLCLVEEIQADDFFSRGRDDKFFMAPMYNRAVADVMALRTALF
jgi:aminopeptidase-like protein